MPTIRLTDNLGLSLDIPVDANLTKYLQTNLLTIRAVEGINQIAQTPLAEVPLKPIGVGLDFADTVQLGAVDAELAIAAGVSGRVGIVKPGETLVGADLAGDQRIVAGPGDAYVTALVKARAKGGVSKETGHLSFGFSANGEVALQSDRRFPASTPFVAAIGEALGKFAVPGDLDDLRALPVGAVCHVTGGGSLEISGGIEVAVSPNPLAVPNLPSIVPAIAIKSGASISVGASLRFSGDYELRVSKLTQTTIRLGYHKSSQTSFQIQVELAAKATANLGKTELLETIIGAISRDAQADVAELQRAGLSAAQIATITSTIKAGIQRNVAASLDAQLSRIKTGEEAFGYEIALDSLTDQGLRAVNAALDGDLSGLAALDNKGALHGVKLIRSAFRSTIETGFRLRINLLGLLNFISVSRLIAEDTVIVDPNTGEVTITDKVTGERLRALMVNAGENESKIRQLFFESMVATVSYRASKMIPALSVSSTHSYFELRNKTRKQDMKDNLDALEAVGLMDGLSKQATLMLASDFGRSTFLLEASYTDEQCDRLFFNEDGTPRSAEFYENAAREALANLVTPDDPNADRRRPAIDDALWHNMKELGNFSLIKPMLRQTLGNNAPVEAIDSDFAFIAAFWGQAMSATARKLREVRQFLAANRNVDADDKRFRALRQSLVKHLKEVATDTKEHFGDPLGLVAMYYASGRDASVSAKLNCPVVQIALPKSTGAAV